MYKNRFLEQELMVYMMSKVEWLRVTATNINLLIRSSKL